MPASARARARGGGGGRRLHLEHGNDRCIRGVVRSVLQQNCSGALHILRCPWQRGAAGSGAHHLPQRTMPPFQRPVVGQAPAQQRGAQM